MNISTNVYYNRFFGKLGFPSKSCNFILFTKHILYIINCFKNEDGLNKLHCIKSHVHDQVSELFSLLLLQFE